MKTHRIGPWSAEKVCPSCGNTVIIGPKKEIRTIEEFDNGVIDRMVWFDANIAYADLDPETNTEIPTDTPLTVFVEHDQHFAGTYKGKFFCSEKCLEVYK